MTNIIKAGLCLVTLTIGLFVVPNRQILAQYYSQGNGVFGVVIDKKIRPITETVYFDNISQEQKIFREKDQLDFELVVENSGNQDLYNLEVKDTLPKYFTPSLYPGSMIDGQIIKTTIDFLGIGQTKVFNIRGIVSNLPASDWANQMIKLTNKAEVYNDKVSDDDYASYFAEKRLNPVTGSGSLILGSIISIVSLLTSIGVRRKIRGY